MPGDYTTTFTYFNGEETANVRINKEYEVEFDTNEVSLNSNKPYNVEDSFNSVTVTKNGVPKVYTTITDFEADGGIVNTSDIPNQLDAGTYEVSFSIHGESKTDYVLVTHYKLNTKDIEIFENDEFNESDGFVSLVITTPDLEEKTYGFEQFIELGGTVTTKENDKLVSGSYTTTYAINDYISTITVRVKDTPVFKITADLGYNGVVYEQEVKQGDTLPSDFFIPEREGYIFVGWYADSQFTTLFDFNKPVDTDLEIFAKWEKEETDESVKPPVNEGEKDKEPNNVPNTGTNSRLNLSLFLIVSNI